MKILAILRKTLLELWREPMLWVLLFVFPIAFVWLYDVAFGQTEAGLGRVLKIMVINQDQPFPGIDQSLGEKLINSLASAEFEGQPVFDLMRVDDRSQAEVILRERKAALLLILPPELSQAVRLARQNPGVASQPVGIKLVGDPTSDYFTFAGSLLDGYVHEFIQAELGWQPSQVFLYEFIPGTGTTSDFDYGVPGLIVFGLMLLSTSTAMVLVRENSSGTLKRLRLAPVKASQLLAGVLLSQMILAMAIVPVTLGVALSLGFHNRGSLLLAIGIGFLVSLSAVGIGLLTACFTHNESEAANLSASLGVLLVLLCDALYPVPALPLITLFGRTWQIYDILPTAHAASALRKLLILGEGASSIIFETGMLLVLSLILFLAGTGLFWKMKGGE